MSSNIILKNNFEQDVLCVGCSASSRRNSRVFVVVVRRRTCSPALYASPIGLELGPEILCLADVFRNSAIPVLI